MVNGVVCPTTNCHWRSVPDDDVFCFSQVPIFVQFHSKWRRLFAGVSEHSGFRTSFDMVQLKNTPHQCSNLYGLLDVFKSKIVSSLLTASLTFTCFF